MSTTSQRPSGGTSGTVPTGSTERWTDRKRYLWLIGLVVPSLASSATACGR